MKSFKKAFTLIILIILSFAWNLHILSDEHKSLDDCPVCSIILNGNTNTNSDLSIKPYFEVKGIIFKITKKNRTNSPSVIFSRAPPLV